MSSPGALCTYADSWSCRGSLGQWAGNVIGNCERAGGCAGDSSGQSYWLCRPILCLFEAISFLCYVAPVVFELVILLPQTLEQHKLEACTTRPDCKHATWMKGGGKTSLEDPYTTGKESEPFVKVPNICISLKPIKVLSQHYPITLKPQKTLQYLVLFVHNKL